MHIEKSPPENNLNEVVVSIVPGTGQWRYAEEVALYFEEFAKAEGGKVWAGWGYPLIRVRFQGIPAWRVCVAKEVAAMRAARMNANLTLIERIERATSIPQPSATDIPWGSVVRRPLTRRLLFGLPRGASLVVEMPGGRLFRAKLGPLATRENIWKRAHTVGAIRRRCRIAWSNDHL